jgi:endoglucanase
LIIIQIECFQNNKGGLAWLSDIIGLFHENKVHYTYWCYYEYNFDIYTNEEGLPHEDQAHNGIISLTRERKNLLLLAFPSPSAQHSYFSIGI